jgi:plasmid stability protein
MCVTLIYVNSRNITFSLPQSLLRAAKVYAAEHDTTISCLVRELLQEKLQGEGRVQAAAKRVLEIAEKGPYFKADLKTIPREELHERS